MAQAKLLLQPYVGLRPVCAHEGQIIALASNQRWSSDGLEIRCWNGEVVRVAFAIDTCDREIIAWQASTGGVTGEMVRNLMLACVERRPNALRAPYPVQWLADNRSAYTARETIEFAAALLPVPSFTPVRSLESNGISAAFVETLKRDDARIQPRPDALTVLQQLPGWMEDYNENHPHSSLKMRSPREFIQAQSQPASCPVQGGNSTGIDEPVAGLLKRLFEPSPHARLASARDIPALLARPLHKSSPPGY
jgi:putative transposase